MQSRFYVPAEMEQDQYMTDTYGDDCFVPCDQSKTAGGAESRLNQQIVDKGMDPDSYVDGTFVVADDSNENDGYAETECNGDDCSWSHAPYSDSDSDNGSDNDSDDGDSDSGSAIDPAGDGYIDSECYDADADDDDDDGIILLSYEADSDTETEE